MADPFFDFGTRFSLSSLSPFVCKTVIKGKSLVLLTNEQTTSHFH